MVSENKNICIIEKNSVLNGNENLTYTYTICQFSKENEK